MGNVEQDEKDGTGGDEGWLEVDMGFLDIHRSKRATKLGDSNDVEMEENVTLRLVGLRLLNRSQQTEEKSFLAFETGETLKKSHTTAMV